MAVFDVIVNHADRKGAHIAPMPGGHRYGVDHGLTFHVADKLRTVLWGWLGEALSEEEPDGVGRVLDGLDGELGRGLAELLNAEEIEALAERCTQLLDDGIFPAPSGLTPAVPWPLF
ncbi:Phosphatidylinositol kinase (fragment) [Micrococcus luteus]